MSDSELIKKQCYLLFDTKVIFSTTPEDIKVRCKDLFNFKSLMAVLDNPELVETCELFFANSLNTTTASKAGFMHRNTLIYRIDKIKRLIGLDIRIFDDAVVLQNLIIFYKTYCKA